MMDKTAGQQKKKDWPAERKKLQTEEGRKMNRNM